MTPDDDELDRLDRIFGPCPRVDFGTLLDELRELRADLRTIERGWHDDDDDDD